MLNVSGRMALNKICTIHDVWLRYFKPNISTSPYSPFSKGDFMWLNKEDVGSIISEFSNKIKGDEGQIA